VRPKELGCKINAKKEETTKHGRGGRIGGGEISLFGNKKVVCPRGISTNLSMKGHPSAGGGKGAKNNHVLASGYNPLGGKR